MLKHSENLEQKEKVKYDLYKILRMSILLNQNEIDRITLEKFKEASLNIDKMVGEIYDKKIDSMFYKTETLEEEEKRLKDLVAFIKNRIEQRKNLQEDYRSVTNKELNDLEYINKSSDLDLYEIRLKTIKNYLDNSKLIEVNEQDLEVLKEQLVKEYDLKSTNEIKNSKLEESLYNKFINQLYEIDLYSSIKTIDISLEVENIQKEILETKEQKDTFEQAFNNLKLSGISGDLELEYASYVENARRNYYYVKEKEIILKLYKLIEEKEQEYISLFKKREEVQELLRERLLLRKELNIKDKDILSEVFELVTDQEREIEEEKENIDNINILTERIKLKENRLEELQKIIKKPEILSILKEYSLIDTYNHEDEVEFEVEEDDDEYENISLEEDEEENEGNKESALELLKDLLPEEEINELEEEKDITTNEQENVTFEEVEEEKIKEEKEYLPNQIKESEMVPTMNFGLSRLKSISVMKRVGDMLGINAKPEKETKEEKIEVPKEEVEQKQDKPQLESEDKKEQPIVEINKDEDLFWTPNEFIEMKNETENTNEKVSVDNKISDDQIFEFQMPEMKTEPKDNQIFESETVNNELIFPEPVIPETKVLPENNEDKFMWPEVGETFDINGIFPS